MCGGKKNQQQLVYWVSSQFQIFLRQTRTDLLVYKSRRWRSPELKNVSSLQLLLLLSSVASDLGKQSQFVPEAPNDSWCCRWQKGHVAAFHIQPRAPLLRILWIATALSVHLIAFWQISFQGVVISTALEVCPYVIAGKTAADYRLHLKERW